MMAKNERKNTIWPVGMPPDALRKLAIDRNTATEMTLSPIPTIGFWWRPGAVGASGNWGSGIAAAAIAGSLFTIGKAARLGKVKIHLRRIDLRPLRRQNPAHGRPCDHRPRPPHP